MPFIWLGPGSGLRYGPAMDDADGYFPERVAATYDDSSEGMFDPAFIDTVAEVLAGLAGGGRGEYRSIPFRYVWPSELDLMARLTGMRLRDRWEDWDRTPFTGESRKHVSVWEKA